MNWKINVSIQLLLTLFFIKALSCQELPEPIPPSPEAFNFATYGNIPLNHSTGGFNYSVPIYTLNENDIQLSIRLDYYTNGINIDELSSNLGVGWNLNAGGVVSRVVKDDPDETVGTRWYPNQVDGDNDYVLVKNAANDSGNLDTEPDWFSFNINGINGSFYLDESLNPNNIIIDCEQDVKITFTRLNLNIISFTIIDQNGYIYRLGGSTEYNELNHSRSCSRGDRQYNSSWFLKEWTCNKKLDFKLSDYAASF